MTSNLLPLQFPKAPGDPLYWNGLHGSATGLAISQAATMSQKLLLVITPDTLTALRLEKEIHFFRSQQQEQNTASVLSFPDWETLPYDHFSPHQDIISQRLTTLFQLPLLKTGIIIAPVTTLMQKIAPPDFLAQSAFVLKVGDQFDPEQVRLTLQARGYYAVSQVYSHGEFSLRGSVFDLYPMGSDLPYRIDLFDNDVDSIRTFDPQTQRSIDKVDSINLLPAREFPLSEAAITLFRQQWRDRFAGNPAECPLYQSITRGICNPGIEYYLPLFFQQTASLFDYMPANTLIIRFNGFFATADNFWEEIKVRFEQNNIDRTRPLLPPAQLFLAPDEIAIHSKKFLQVEIQNPLSEQARGGVQFSTEIPPQFPIDHKLDNPLQALQQYLNQHPKERLLFCAESAGRRESLLELLQKTKLHPHSYQCWDDFVEGSQPVGITIGALTQGLKLSNPALTIITEAQLFGQQVMQRRRRKEQYQDSDALIRNLAELAIGSAVVHLDHGVGRYLGLQTITTMGITAEYLTLEYAEGNKLYVPISSLHLISRYSGVEIENAPLHQLGNTKWQKTREKAAKQIRDVAAELLEIYAKRAHRKGHRFAEPDQHYATFAATFPFEETPDQQQAIAQVVVDMTTEKPMDRLVCGDVGFGKTEVAMRAAFIAAEEGRQVAVLVPTTLLAQQHYETFKDRFANWPINIDVISRFRSPKEQKQIIEQVGVGKVDIIIGTHRLLQSDIVFKQLGLVIIDEEHRFGVHQKERLKKMRAEVDILTLTATPIPRTLNMAMSGVRDLSIIATPPAKRLSIKTFVHEYSKSLIREAVLREILRGGQVYYLHNKVDTIHQVAAELHELVPEAQIGIGHGQMRERELEKVMADFYHQRFNILVCTTIIETGIDIPSANTIIIDQANQFGLAQLHQLRGRVGRSHHQAYAYLITPPKPNLSKDAIKRLEAIASLEDLGAGFTLATHDLEIRGAGEFLGDEQSGNIQAIGLSLYTELLEKAVSALQQGKEPDFDLIEQKAPEIDLALPALIPSDYLPDVHTRLILYKRIASAKTMEELDDLQVEMIDRFGLLPAPAKSLFRLTELKLQAQLMGIRKIDANRQTARLEFSPHTTVTPLTIIKLVQHPSGRYKFDATTNHLRYTFLAETDDGGRIGEVEKLLERLRAKG